MQLKIEYQEKYPEVNYLDIKNIHQYRKAFGIKSQHWSYEEERRIIKAEDHEGPGLYSFEPELMTGVILGARMDEDSKDKVLHWIEDYPTEITVYQAKLNEYEYKLDIIPLSELE